MTTMNLYDDLQPMHYKQHLFHRIMFYVLYGGLLVIFTLSPTVKAEDETPTDSSLASSSQNPSIPAPHPNFLISTDATQLSEALPEEATWLEIPNGKILALHRPNYAKIPKGALLIITSSDLTKKLPPEIESTRINLPHAGWETLTIDTKRNLFQSTTISITENSATTPTDHLKEILVSSLKFLNDRGQFNLILMVDNNIAPQIMALLSNALDKKIGKSRGLDSPMQMLILLNTHPNISLTEKELTGIFQNKELPVFDIFLGSEDENIKNNKRRHRAIANQRNLNHYHQALLNNQLDQLIDQPHNFLTNRIRGYMDKNALGEKIDIERQENHQN